MDIIFIESVGSLDPFSVALRQVQKWAGSTEKDRTAWWTHVILRADSLRLPDGDHLIFESTWDSVYLRMNFWSRFQHKRYRVYRDKNNSQNLHSLKPQLGKKMYGYLQILGYLPIIFLNKRINFWPSGEVCVETAHRWALEEGYRGPLEMIPPDNVWPVLLEDLLRASPDFELVETRF